MHKINKGAPCEDFEKFNRARYDNWDETKGHRRIWREFIINNEQNVCSGYTEAPINVDGSHIDHFRKQALFQDYIFHWENYVADSLDEDYGAKYKDKHILLKEDNLKLINPVEENVECFFYYEANGKMVPAEGLNEQDKERALFTIEKFNLNHQSLKDRRRLLLNTDLESYDGCSREDLMEYLSLNGFKSVAAQTIDEWFKYKEGQEGDK